MVFAGGIEYIMPNDRSLTAGVASSIPVTLQNNLYIDKGIGTLGAVIAYAENVYGTDGITKRFNLPDTSYGSLVKRVLPGNAYLIDAWGKVVEQWDYPINAGKFFSVPDAGTAPFSIAVDGTYSPFQTGTYWDSYRIVDAGLNINPVRISDGSIGLDLANIYTAGFGSTSTGLFITGEIFFEDSINGDVANYSASFYTAASAVQITGEIFYSTVDHDESATYGSSLSMMPQTTLIVT